MSRRDDNLTMDTLEHAMLFLFSVSALYPICCLHFLLTSGLTGSGKEMTECSYSVNSQDFEDRLFNIFMHITNNNSNKFINAPKGFFRKNLQK